MAFRMTTLLTKTRHWLQSRSRLVKQVMLILTDSFLLTFILWLAFSFRFDRIYYLNEKQLLLTLAAAAIAIPIFIYMGLYRAVMRYLTGHAIWTILRAGTISALLWVCLIFLTNSFGTYGIPRSIAVVYWLGSCAAMVGSRLFIKWLFQDLQPKHPNAKRVLIFGAGANGVQLANALNSTGDFHVVGFISEDPGLKNMNVMGVKVYSSTHLHELLKRIGISEIIIASGSHMAQSQRDLIAKVGSLPVKIRVLPPITDLAAGKFLVSYIRDIDIDDLLGRPPVTPDPALLQEPTKDRVIMITGAAGSIGSELCRTVAQQKPSKLVLLDFNELGLYNIQREMQAYGDFTLVPILGSIANAELIRSVISTHQVNTIYHCAAYKHVPIVEANDLEGIRNNVFGTLILTKEAYQSDVEKFILISSDKAVNPKSIMGATKRGAELIVSFYGSLIAESDQKRTFSCVRFGNVIGSSGSVVPLFKQQIANGGPITLTDENITRYFMSIREAAELIIQAATLSNNSDILVLDMGQPVKIKDLAHDMIMLSGLTERSAKNPTGDIEIVTIGMHPAEKLHEELFYNSAETEPTEHPKIMRSKQIISDRSYISDMLERLQKVVSSGNSEKSTALLFALTSLDAGQPHKQKTTDAKSADLLSA